MKSVREGVKAISLYLVVAAGLIYGVGGYFYVLWDSLYFLLRRHKAGWLSGYFLIVIPMALAAGSLAAWICSRRGNPIHPEIARWVSFFGGACVGAYVLHLWLKH